MRAEAGRHCTAVATLRTMWGPGRNSARPVPRQRAGPMTCSDRRCTLARTYLKNLKTVVRGCRWLRAARSPGSYVDRTPIARVRDDAIGSRRRMAFGDCLGGARSSRPYSPVQTEVALCSIFARQVTILSDYESRSPARAARASAGVRALLKETGNGKQTNVEKVEAQCNSREDPDNRQAAGRGRLRGRAPI